MCLLSETVYVKPLKKERWVWKALSYDSDNHCWLTGPVCGGRVKYNTWLTARTASGCDESDKGWYCFTSREGAVGYGDYYVVRVKVRNIIAKGYTDGHSAIRALEMYIPSEEKPAKRSPNTLGFNDLLA